MKYQGRPRSQAKCRQSLGGNRHQSDRTGGETGLEQSGRHYQHLHVPHPQAQPPVQEQLGVSKTNSLLFPWSGGTNWSDTSVILVTQSDPGLSRYYHGASCVIYVRGRACLPALLGCGFIHSPVPASNRSRIISQLLWAPSLAAGSSPGSPELGQGSD